MGGGGERAEAQSAVLSARPSTCLPAQIICWISAQLQTRCCKCRAKFEPNGSSLQESPREVEANEQKLKAQYSAPAIDLSAGADHPLDLSMKPLPWRKQYAVLCHRSFQEARRKWVSFATMCGQVYFDGLSSWVFNS